MIEFNPNFALEIGLEVQNAINSITFNRLFFKPLSSCQLNAIINDNFFKDINVNLKLLLMCRKVI